MWEETKAVAGREREQRRTDTADERQTTSSLKKRGGSGIRTPVSKTKSKTKTKSKKAK